MAKGKYIRSDETRLKNSASLKGNIPWNLGKRKEKPILSQAELDNIAAIRKQKLTARALKTAATRRKKTVKHYLDLMTNEIWKDAQFKTDDRGIDYLRLTHVTCGTSLEVQVQTIRKHSAQSTLCKTCNPIFRGSSRAEDEIYEFISTLTPGAVRHHKLRSGLELDVLLPNLNLAIEYNGLYWHSELRGYPPLKHLQKTEEAGQAGLKLIQIFEDEWIHKKELVKSRLQIALGVEARKIYARKTVVRELDSATCARFLKENHLQGNTPAKIRLGLFYGNELISAMTFGKPRFNKKFDWELIRFASKQGTRVIGGAGKLLSNFRKTYVGTVISYADRRWSDGALYEALGFTQVGVSQPSYWYFKGDLRENRQTYQKAKLKDLPEFSADKTEVEIMFEAGWNRIWDCGNLVYSLA